MIYVFMQNLMHCLPDPMVIICGYAKINKLRAGWATREADSNLLNKIKRVL